ncbi:tetratricopeptide repeat protein [Chitinispirillales bacterium ANBcel5]|uniref:tetratricopeptide repeat protein n=1 Tax=Cellulosispirillum alkaliphilum TaxID=3039283 RepID=UPI002A5247B1|nr:tetratricopeptide repeat protein [Chitinispirillales bacterium ANBcel5]
MKKCCLFVIAFVLLVKLTGCSHMTVLRTQELREIQAKIDTLNNDMESMKKEIIAEHNKTSEMLRLLRADQQVRFNELDRKIVTIETNLLESQSRLSNIDRKTAEFTRKLEEKLSAEAEAERAREQEIENLFKLSKRDFDAGRYDIALPGFKDIIKQYPDSHLVSEAEYWIAEIYYAQRDYQKAEQAFMDLIRKYPDGERICVSLYKLGLVYERQEMFQSRDMVWENLIKQCPGSQEAQVVENQIEGE